MTIQENRASFKRTFDKAIAIGAALLCLTGFINTAHAAYDPCCYDQYACNMPDFVIYGDFIYWQVNPEGSQFALRNGLDFSEGAKAEQGSILSLNCDYEPGFRIGLLADLGCCNWDFYAQYTWMNQCFHAEKSVGVDGENFIRPLVYNFRFETGDLINFARAEWDSTFNVVDFGLGRTFSVNGCFDFRPHLGFKATWQELQYKIRYEQIETSDITEKIDIHNKTDFDGIGLRGGFDAAWRFSSCLSLVGGAAMSAVWSDIEVKRKDTFTTFINETPSQTSEYLNFKQDSCVLIPVSEILLGLRYDTTLCSCYNVFIFFGWENQVWWNLNRFLYVELNEGANGIQFGPQGNITYQGLTVRTGLSY